MGKDDFFSPRRHIKVSGDVTAFHRITVWLWEACHPYQYILRVRRDPWPAQLLQWGTDRHVHAWMALLAVLWYTVFLCSILLTVVPGWSLQVPRIIIPIGSRPDINIDHVFHSEVSLRHLISQTQTLCHRPHICRHQHPLFTCSSSRWMLTRH